MNLRDFRFLLLTGKMGDPDRNPLMIPQLRTIAQRIRLLEVTDQDETLNLRHLELLGIDAALSRRILRLLEDDLQLKAYLARAEKQQCRAVTRTSELYPLILRKRLGLEAPGCLWLKGDVSILSLPAVALVGSRELMPENRIFAREAGRQAARQGFALVSGNARGADIAAQNGCLETGGYVISVVADSLEDHCIRDHVLYISEEDFDAPFSAQRALRRNRVIHSLGEITFVAQSSLGKGGTWDGSIRNLRNLWSPLFCYQDGSEAAAEMERMGANLIEKEELQDFSVLTEKQLRFI